MEQMRWKEYLYLNLESMVAIYSTQYGDEERGISTDLKAGLMELFGEKISYIEVQFEASNAKKEMDNIVLRYADGSSKSRKPTGRESKKILEIANKLFMEDGILLPVNQRRELEENSDFINWHFVDESEDADALKELFREFLQDTLSNDWILDKEFYEIFKKLHRKFFDDFGNN